MCVRPLLPLRVHARSMMLDKRGCFSQSAVRVDWQGSDAAAIVIGYQNPFPGPVDHDVGWSIAFRRHAIQECQMACSSIDRKSAYAAILFGIHRVQKTMVRMHSQKGGIRGLGREADTL